MAKLNLTTRRDVKRARLRTGGGFALGITEPVQEFTEIKPGDKIEIHVVPEYPKCLVIKKLKTKD